MSDDFSGIRINAIVPARDIHDYLVSRSESDHPIDVEASLDAYEQGIRQTLQNVYPGAGILVRLQQHPTPSPPQTRVESDAAGVDTGEIEQEVVDLIAEFDITACIVYRDNQ
jgi:hypothetical protein